MEVPTAIIMGGRARSPAFGRLTGSKVTKMSELTHFDEAGQAHMVNVGEKSETHRIAVACGRIHMQPATFELVAGGTAKKGDVIGIARVAAMAHAAGALVIVDASMTELIRPALYGSYHNIENITSEEEARDKYTIVGTACESTDVFDENVTLRKTRRGDLLTIKSAGAYGMSMASRYNLHDLPGAVYSDEIQ